MKLNTVKDFRGKIILKQCYLTLERACFAYYIIESAITNSWFVSYVETYAVIIT
jgi:hypothetical protein